MGNNRVKLNDKILSDDELKNEIIKYYINNNHTIQETADYFDVNITTITRKLKKFNIRKSKELIEESKKMRNREKYGVDYPLQLEETTRKREQTNLEKYGYKNQFQRPDIIEDIQDARSEKMDKIVSKTKDTWNKRYGGHPLSNKEVQLKAKQTNLKRYGVEYSSQNDDIKKRKKISRIKYFEENSEEYNLLRDKERFKQIVLSIPYEERTSTSCAEKMGIHTTTFNKWFKLHNLKEEISMNFQRSRQEQEITEYIKSFYTGIVINNYKLDMELDIYLPELKLGIEFNGTYYHDVEHKGKGYHQEKSFYFKEKGIFVYHIYEWEWEDDIKREIIKNSLRRMILNDNKVIYARKCELKEVGSSESSKFLNQYHIQGNVNATIRYGLYYEDTLVEIMTFSKARYTDGYEIIRLCSKSDINVVGGTERLFKHFIEQYNPSRIISYCNIDKFKGTIYEKVGMKLDKINPPNYKWVNCNDNDVKSRYQCQKHLIREDENDTRTESEIMKSRGYIKVEDAGTYRFILER